MALIDLENHFRGHSEIRLAAGQNSSDRLVGARTLDEITHRRITFDRVIRLNNPVAN